MFVLEVYTHNKELLEVHEFKTLDQAINAREILIREDTNNQFGPYKIYETK